jgi:hypothetical protein
VAAKEVAIRTALAVPGRPGVRVIAGRFKVNPSTVQRISARNELTVARRRDQPALRGIGLVALQLLLAALSSWRFNLLNVLAAGIIAGLALTWHRAT